MILRLYQICLFITEITKLYYLIVATLLSPFITLIRPKPEKNVKDQVILITGAGSGLGRQMALQFSKRDAILVLWDRNEDSVRMTVDLIKELVNEDSRVHYFIVDVSDENEVALAAQKVRTSVGDVEILINNAGIAPCEPFKQLSNDKIKEVFSINILSHFWTTKQFLPAMEKNNSGHIVAIASSAGIMGSPYFTAYGASKHAVVGFMKCLYEELDVNSQIKLTTICPLGISGTGIDIPTKTRYPLLLPIMTLDYAINKIVEAILHEEEFVVLPNTYRWIHRLINIFPLKLSSSIWRCLDYEVVPTGVYAPIGRAHYYDRVKRKVSINHHNYHFQQQQQYSNGRTKNR